MKARAVPRRASGRRVLSLALASANSALCRRTLRLPSDLACAVGAACVIRSRLSRRAARADANRCARAARRGASSSSGRRPRRWHPGVGRGGRVLVVRSTTRHGQSDDDAGILLETQILGEDGAFVVGGVDLDNRERTETSLWCGVFHSYGRSISSRSTARQKTEERRREVSQRSKKYNQEAEDGSWKTEDGRRKTKNGRRETEDGRQKKEAPNTERGRTRERRTLSTSVLCFQ